LFIPVGKEDEEQWIMIYDKDEHGHITETKWLGVKVNYKQTELASIK